ncbi:class I SAM-dependent methyltransferase [Streptomyces sp. NRRL B-24484]|uniref:class I SAM-dependent methyltransferase n=1 Tax=Streptomyces sp. NRRL B-24484 TaxID=1463833 RepID=UPI0004C092D2|nr:methyltransferase domain-containing protein [Streptomyces sp. NRRL B-24484]
MALDGSIPGVYQEYLVPILVRPYARDLAARAVTHRPARVLETAAGTGAVTRELAAVLPGSTGIVATDLSAPMLGLASSSHTGRPVDFRQADALDLPFPDDSFDVVVCQFGAMFFPDKPRAFAEARRVLRPGGVLLFNVWDHIAANEFAAVAAAAVAALVPEDPPDFMARVLHGYHDHVAIARDVEAGGFEAPRIETVDARSRAGSAVEVATAYCQGTPMRNEIEARPGISLAEATDAVASAVGERFGDGPVEGAMRAHVVTATAAVGV